MTASSVAQPNRRRFYRRQLLHSVVSFAVLALSLVIGMVGYRHFEGMTWLDAFLNSAMLLGGMGPVAVELSGPGKLFAGIYALYCGLVVIAVTGLLLAPGVHHLMKKVDWEDRDA